MSQSTFIVCSCKVNTYSSDMYTILILLFLQAKIGSGKLMGPKGVSVDRNGHIIVVDNKACCVFIFQINGKLVTKFGNRGNGDKQFAGIVQIHVFDCPLW